MADDNVVYRMGQLEKDVSALKGDVKKILVNHLPHLQKDIAILSTRMAIFGSLILTALGALIAIALQHLGAT